MSNNISFKGAWANIKLEVAARKAFYSHEGYAGTCKNFESLQKTSDAFIKSVPTEKSHEIVDLVLKNIDRMAKTSISIERLQNHLNPELENLSNSAILAQLDKLAKVDKLSFAESMYRVKLNLEHFKKSWMQA